MAPSRRCRQNRVRQEAEPPPAGRDLVSIEKALGDRDRSLDNVRDAGVVRRSGAWGNPDEPALGFRDG